jgi:hypothetical protein
VNVNPLFSIYGHNLHADKRSVSLSAANYQLTEISLSFNIKVYKPVGSLIFFDFGWYFYQVLRVLTLQH